MRSFLSRAVATLVCDDADARVAHMNAICRACVSVIAFASWIAIGVAGAEPDAREIVKRVQTYLAQWERALAAVVAEERYTQVLHLYQQTGRGVRRTSSASRTLVSDVLLIRAPAEDVWLTFRDVVSVDGVPVRDRQRRFDELFVKPDADLVANARRIADESARFNLGRLTRNLNTPTAALVFLHSPYVEHTRWKRGRDARVDGTPAWVLTFEQREPPFAVRRLDGRPQPASGRVWLEPESARILQIEVSMSDRTMHAYVRTKYGKVEGIDTWVPMRMDDKYELGTERTSGEAVYTNHRLFQTGARIIGGASSR
jgi:hypothetical protein